MKAGAGALSPFIAHSDESGQCNMALLPSPRLMRDHVLDLQHRSRHDTPASPNWFTPEFFLYYFILLVALYSIFFSAYSFSQEAHPAFPLYRHRLSRGWLLGKPWVDTSDVQYTTFRSNILILVLTFLVFTMLNKLLMLAIQRLSRRGNSGASRPRSPTFSSPSDGDVDALQLKARRIYLFLFSTIFLIVLHGSNFLFVQLALLINFGIAQLGRSKTLFRVIPAMTWLFTLGSLFGSAYLEYVKIADYLPFLAFLDTYFGFYKRWFITYNFAILRMISFNIDLWDSVRTVYQNQASIVPIEDSPSKKHAFKCHECLKPPTNFVAEPLYGCQKYRVLKRLPLSEYTFVNFQVFALYIPLYLSGPIISFNDFMYQLKRPLFGKFSDYNFKSVIVYGLRLLTILFLMELLTHLLFVVAVKDTKSWKDFSPLEMMSLGYWNLKIVWLKLMIIWRFSRFWAMCDGLITTENMMRCMSNNYSGLSFWRSWHRSFNLWLLRYVYIPLGGRPHMSWNIWVVFLFVAFWHDRTSKLFLWGGLICMFIVPELVVDHLRKRYFRDLHVIKPFTFRMLKGLLASFNVYLMAIANIVGFVICDVDQILPFFAKIYAFDLHNLVFLFLCFMTSFSAVQIMFEVRAQEQRNGIHHNF